MSDSVTRAGASRPELSELFTAFLGISLTGFGGVLPWARRMLVEKRRWIDDAEFVEVLSLCQFLPGPNIVNMGIILGSRFRGAAGAVAAVSGLVGVPLLIMMALGALYARYGDVAALRGTLAGLAAGAAGLLVAMVARMTMPLVRANDFVGIAFVLAAFAAVGLFRFPLYGAVLVLAPLGIALAWRRIA